MNAVPLLAGLLLLSPPVEAGDAGRPASLGAYAPTAATGPALLPLAGLLGRWVGATEETWVAAGDVYFGVGFTTRPGRPTSFEVMRVEDRGGVRFVAQPGGAPPVVFARVEGAGLVVVNPDHDFPRRIAYRWVDGRHGATLTAVVDAGAAPGEDVATGRASREGPTLRLRWRAAAPPPPADPVAAGVLAADRAFAAEVGTAGAAAWDRWFAADGAHWDGERNLAPGAELVAAMTPLLDGGARLQWAPTAVGLAPAGDLAFTVGEWTWTPPEGGPGLSGGYVTVWARQPDGAWKVRYDTGAARPSR